MWEVELGFKFMISEEEAEELVLGSDTENLSFAPCFN